MKQTWLPNQKQFKNTQALFVHEVSPKISKKLVMVICFWGEVIAE